MIPEIQRLRNATDYHAALNQLFQYGQFAGIAAQQPKRPSFNPRQPLTARAVKLLAASNAWHGIFRRRPLPILKG